MDSWCRVAFVSFFFSHLHGSPLGSGVFFFHFVLFFVFLNSRLVCLTQNRLWGADYLFFGFEGIYDSNMGENTANVYGVWT